MTQLIVFPIAIVIMYRTNKKLVQYNFSDLELWFTWCWSALWCGQWMQE